MAPREYCGNCGRLLDGVADDQPCAGCGRPARDTRVSDPLPHLGYAGRRYESPARVFGRPLVSVALGPAPGELRGHARGIIAIGDFATGWVAIGGIARGFVAVGGFALGVVALGGGAVGMLALGGLVVAAAYGVGGVAVAAGVAQGGVAIGYVADGGAAIGYFVRGGALTGVYQQSPMGTDARAAELFNSLAWLVGASRATVGRGVLVLGLAAAALAAMLAGIVVLGLRFSRRRPAGEGS